MRMTRDFRWHFCDMAIALANVRYLGKNGLSSDKPRLSRPPRVAIVAVRTIH
jgi:hypothetical protein